MAQNVSPGDVAEKVKAKELADEDWAARAAAVGLNRAPRTELGRLLVAAREEYLFTHGRFQSDEEFERERAEQRREYV